MTDNLTTDASNSVQAVKKQVSKSTKTARKVISKAKKDTGKVAKRTARTRAAKSPDGDSAARFIGGAKDAFNDAYGWAGNSSKRMTKAARKAGIPSEYANERSLIAAAVGLGVSVAVGALIMGYGRFGEKRSTDKQPSSRKRSNRKA
jgi:hypothetical protein